MLESEMSAQEQAVTQKVTQHLHEQCAFPPLFTRAPCFAVQRPHTSLRRYQQEFQKMSEDHAANMEALRKAHEAEMAAALVREESNLLQVIPPAEAEVFSKKKTPNP